MVSDNRCITVQEFIDFLQKLPTEVKDKEIQFVDFSWVRKIDEIRADIDDSMVTIS